MLFKLVKYFLICPPKLTWFQLCQTWIPNLASFSILILFTNKWECSYYWHCEKVFSRINCVGGGGEGGEGWQHKSIPRHFLVGYLDSLLKACVSYFVTFFFFFHQMVALQKLWKMVFIWSEKLFSFSRYSIFCIFIFPSFFIVSHCFRAWFKIILKVYGVINFINKNLITHFVWYLEKEKSYEIET